MSQVYQPGDAARLEAVASVVLERYDPSLGRDLELANLSENATFFVRGAGPEIEAVLRVHRVGYNDPTQIASELVWMDALREQTDIAIPRIINAQDGSRVVIAEGAELDEPRACVMFEHCPGGEPPEEEMLPWYGRLGTIAAQMHAQVRGWAPPPWFDRRTWDFATSVGGAPHWGRWEDGIGVGDGERRQLGRLRDELGERLSAYGTGPERFGLVHADMRLANLLVAGSDVFVIDFDDCGYSWFLYDLAASFTFIEDRADLGELIAAWSRGYSEVRPLSEPEVQILPSLIMLRRLLVVAWIGSHASTDLAQSEGAEYTRVSCELAERYLGGTVDWV